MKFKKKDLQDAVADEAEGFEAIEDKLVDTTRWANHYEFVFKFEGAFYKTNYSVGATEIQDEGPFEYADDEIECRQVWPHEVTVVKYLPKKP